MVIRAILFALAIIAIAPNAFAAGGKEEYEKAVKFSKAGEYEAALPHFKKAYTLSGKRPSTILALAQCERSLKMYEDAIVHFKEYRNSEPTPKDAKKVDDTIVLLEEILAQQKEANAQAKAPEPAPKTEPEPAASKEPPPIAAAPAQRESKPAPAAITETRATPPPAKSDDESIVENPVFWAVAAGVVFVAGGVGIAVALGGGDDPYGGTSGVILHK